MAINTDFSRYLGINWTLTLIWCFFYIFLQAETHRISQTAGSTVTLNCSNDSIINLTQLSWKMNGEILFTIRTDKTLNSSSNDSKVRFVTSSKAESLKLNMSMLKSQLYALTITRAQRWHTGNYTCEFSASKGVGEKKWELVITEDAEAGNQLKIPLAIAVIVPCTCFLIFLITIVIIQRKVCKRRSRSRSPASIMEQKEDIYENCLELENRRRSQIQVQPYKYRVQ
ncbi:uncharacterized protein LOC120717446 isoform X1 [Simochromis diagramma]|uniref:uncharacterized protein LOC120717446 isoform X1 n=1 Tax=Simochromis diagramma TaxID=43689 RepID=UPI001A7E6537|nr:uncharacterized protein LOC120717446 isoform X1 [Simochromis diagramma]